MASLLHDLLLDLKRRAEYVLKELAALGPGLPSEFQAHHSSTTERITRTAAAIEGLLNDPDLGDPLLEPNFFIDFKRLSELILNVEDSSLLILKRCCDDDRLLSAILQNICTEVGYKDAPPLCGALSFQYFQALVGMDIIMAPQTQVYEVLAIPDLYHELAHFVVFRRRDPFEVLALALIHRHFTNALRKAQQQGSPQAAINLIIDSHALWAGDWQVEFLCDMVATFWCGPAYGWANLRLSATRGDPYQQVFTHPADDARRIGIACMLKLIGEPVAAQQIDAKWDELKRLSPSTQPAGYNRRYPIRLLEELAEAVHQTCIAAGFQSFAQQSKGLGVASVCRLVNAAWTSFVTNAAGFSQFEASALQQLHQLCRNTLP
jgi:hypothetical protein